MTSSRAHGPWVKPVKVALRTKDQCTNLHNMKTSRNLEHVTSCLPSIPLEITPGHWSLDARTLAQDNFGRQFGMLACESRKGFTTLSRILEVMIVFQHPGHLQVGLLFT
jgi:hypothetical protein